MTDELGWRVFLFGLGIQGNQRAYYLHARRLMGQVTSRPSGVVLVVVLMAWSGLLTIASIIPPLAPAGIPGWAMALDGALGIVMFIVAWGLFTLRPWAYIVTLGIQAVNGIFGIITVIAVPKAWPAWLAIGIAVVLIGYLTRPHVRGAFGMLRAGETYRAC